MAWIRALGALLLAAAAAVAQAALTVTGVPERAPFVITATATAAVLRVELALEPEWHCYARDVGGGQPVALSLAEPCDFVANGALRLPPDHAGKLTGRVRLELPIAPRGASAQLHAELALQVCDALECLPPMSIAIDGTLGDAAAFPVLLVVDVRDEHAARIEGFLRERGFTVTTTTYGEATAEDCDRNAVVLADSKLFGKGAKVLDQVRKFPPTKTPIVAVGFFGTELIEAHGVAMTSGYI